MEAIIYGGLMHCETDCHSHTHSLSGVYFTTDFTEKCNKLMKPGNLYVIDSGVSKPTQINSKLMSMMTMRENSTHPHRVIASCNTKPQSNP